jgi:hypothetical protein
MIQPESYQDVAFIERVLRATEHGQIVRFVREDESDDPNDPERFWLTTDPLDPDLLPEENS